MKNKQNSELYYVQIYNDSKNCQLSSAQVYSNNL